MEAYCASRGLYEPYEAFSGGSEVADWKGLLALLARSDASPTARAELRDHTTALAERHYAFRDGENTARVYSEIVGRFPRTR